MSQCQRMRQTRWSRRSSLIHQTTKCDTSSKQLLHDGMYVFTFIYVFFFFFCKTTFIYVHLFVSLSTSVRTTIMTSKLRVMVILLQYINTHLYTAFLSCMCVFAYSIWTIYFFLSAASRPSNSIYIELYR